MWIKTDYDFGYPYRVFTVSIRDVMAANNIKSYLNDFRDDPKKLEETIQAMVEFYRPNLKGGSVCGIMMCGGMVFEIAYTHPSLPRMLSMNGPEKESLVPNEHRLGEVQIADDKTIVSIHSEIK